MKRVVCLLFGAAALFAAGDAGDDLLAAARKGDVAAAKALVEKGAPLEATTPYGQTPLYLAAMNGHEALVKYLLEKGAKPNVQDTFYKAPMLAFAVQRKHYGVARILVQNGAGTPDENIGMAAMIGSVELADAVLASGKPGQKALDDAYESALTRKQTALAELLKKAGAREPAPAAAADLKILESYAGDYKSEQIPLGIKVSVQEGRLVMQASGQPEFVPKAKSNTVFEFAPAQLTVEFTAPGTFVLKQGGGTFTFKKAVTQ